MLRSLRRTCVIEACYSNRDRKGQLVGNSLDDYEESYLLHGGVIVYICGFLKLVGIMRVRLFFVCMQTVASKNVVCRITVVPRWH